jgi:galactokinase/mevalonate kinase-like predicted kinase
MQNLGIVATAVMDTASSLAVAAVDAVRRKTVGEGTVGSKVAGAGAEGLLKIFGKREWRVPCLDILIRL